MFESNIEMRATSSFHNKPWFSNVAISMDSEESNDYLSDQELYYGQVIQFVRFAYTLEKQWYPPISPKSGFTLSSPYHQNPFCRNST